ncbi:MAG: fructosamine kinase family protein [Geminicoccaceae bacterium]
MDEALAARVEKLLGIRPVQARRLHGGCLAEVLQLELHDGSTVVAKWGGEADLPLEARMLEDLRKADVPTPAVLAVEPGLLLLQHVPHDAAGAPGTLAQRHAAEILARLHAVTGSAFGYHADVRLGPLVLPSPWTDSWVHFFRDHRLLPMAAEASAAGELPAAIEHRIERLAGRLDGLIDEPAHPSLIHGDLWTGNLLTRGDRVVALIDPAVHYAHPESELAMTTLFGTFGRAFFEHYAELVPLAPDFARRRRDLYNLVPLLVHLRLFGRSYLPSIERTLVQLGF